MPRKAFKYPYKYREGDIFKHVDAAKLRTWIGKTSRGYYYIENNFGQPHKRYWKSFEDEVAKGWLIQIEGQFM